MKFYRKTLFSTSVPESALTYFGGGQKHEAGNLRKIQNIIFCSQENRSKFLQGNVADPAGKRLRTRTKLTPRSHMKSYLYLGPRN